MGADLDDAGGARKLAEEQFVVLAAGPHPDHADHLGTARSEADPGGVGTACESAGDGVRRVGGAAQSQHPPLLAEAFDVAYADDAYADFRSQPPEAPGDRLVGDAEYGGEPAEGRASVDVQGLQQLPVERVRCVRFHR